MSQSQYNKFFDCLHNTPFRQLVGLTLYYSEKMRNRGNSKKCLDSTENRRLLLKSLE